MRRLRRHGASMRPPEFTGGNLRRRPTARGTSTASMRPPEFTGGNSKGAAFAHATNLALQ